MWWVCTGFTHYTVWRFWRGFRCLTIRIRGRTSWDWEPSIVQIMGTFHNLFCWFVLCLGWVWSSGRVHWERSSDHRARCGAHSQEGTSTVFVTMCVCPLQCVCVRYDVCVSVTMCVCPLQCVCVRYNVCVSLTMCVRVRYNVCVSVTMCVCPIWCAQNIECAYSVLMCSWCVISTVV